MNEFNDSPELLDDMAKQELLHNLEGIQANDFTGEKNFLEAFSDAIKAFIDTLANIFGNSPEAREFNESYAERAADVMCEVFDEKTIREWGDMSLEARAEKLNEYYAKLGDALGIDAVGVIVEDCWATLGETGVLGYNGGDGYLYIDYRNLQDPEKLVDVLNTTTHEARHQLQFEAIQNPSRFPEISPNLIKEWEHNMTNYDNGAFGYEGYSNQGVEVDARVFAEDVIAAYIKKMGF